LSWINSPGAQYRAAGLIYLNGTGLWSVIIHSNPPPPPGGSSREATMPTIRVTRRVYHSADEMFDLVADVERYPAFVPLCRVHVIRSREKRVETEILTTDMTVAYRVFCETFTSHVTLDRGNGRILVESVNGPLRRLQTRWTFQSRPDGSCDVGFHLSYELASRTLAFLMGGIFDAAFSRFAQAFAQRADVVYGHPHRPSRHQRWTARLESKRAHEHLAAPIARPGDHLPQARQASRTAGG
jgi:coenzyme Q-binding protein COQ10